MDTVTRDFKTSSNRFSKLLKVFVNPGHENLGKIMPDPENLKAYETWLPKLTDPENLKAYETWLPKLLTIVSNLFGPGTRVINDHSPIWCILCEFF